MINKILYLSLMFFLFSSCKNGGNHDDLITIRKIDSTKLSFSEKSSNNHLLKNYNFAVNFIKDTCIRGDGIIYFEFEDIKNNELNILNEDKTLYGVIFKKDEKVVFGINSSKKEILARNILVNFEGFSSFTFDAEEIAPNSEYLSIYINGESKMIEKRAVNYTFQLWEKYINNVFIELTDKVYCTKESERYYLYTSLKIKNDSMLIKSIPQSSCYLVDDYEDIVKWIRWKDTNNCIYIKFTECF